MQVSEERRRLLQANIAAIHPETVACIKSAFLALMEQKPYDDISMTDVIRKSGVSRAGVYYNYKNKSEILLDICQDPINEVISGLTYSIFDNMEAIFRIGMKYKSSFRILIAAGLEHEILNRMNRLFEDVSTSFYIPLWNGMIYNAFMELARAGMPGTVEEAIEKVNAGLKLVAASIETGLRNETQNQKL